MHAYIHYMHFEIYLSLQYILEIFILDHALTKIIDLTSSKATSIKQHIL